MANVTERPVDRKRPDWMPGFKSQWGSEDKRHHGQTAHRGDEPH